MSASINIVFLLGNLGRDPELKYSQTGNPMTRLSLATNEYGKDGQNHVEWHSVMVFGKDAENCCRFLHKGSSVHVEGSLRTRSWEQNGEKRYVTEVVARRIQFLDRSNGEGRQINGDESKYIIDQRMSQNSQYTAPSQPQREYVTDQTPF
jgi:single-strand DNA-binding protein